MKQTQKEVSENPFYGYRALLTMQTQLQRTSDADANAATVRSLLNTAWAEVKMTKEHRQLFFILMFSFGDIENRQHNIFPVKVDQGGHSKRRMFRMCLDWVLSTKDAEQYFYPLMPVIAEYTNYENLFYNQLRTDKSKTATREVLQIDKKKVASYLVDRLKVGEQMEKQLIVKFLPKWPSVKRWRKDKEGKSFAQPKRAATLQKDQWNKDLINAINTEAGWTLPEYKAFRSEHLKNTEAHLFSTKKICEFDELQFKSWLDTLPSGARYRVQRRLFDVEEYSKALKSKEKWKLKSGKDMGGVYLAWIKAKEEAMKLLVSLTEEDKKEMSAAQLQKLEKTAKINTGATTLFEAFMNIYINGSQIDVNNPETQVRIQHLVDKLKIDVPVLVILDVSGSMQSNVSVGGKNLSRLQFAMFCAALMLYKNPSEDMKSFMITFGSQAQVISDDSFVNSQIGKNRYVPQTKQIKLEQLVLKGKPFIDTFKQLQSILRTDGATDLSCVSRDLKQWVDSDASTKSIKIEAIRAYPVFLVISDGDLNSSWTPKDSFQKFKSEMLQWFGADPLIVLWDIKSDSRSESKSQFEDTDNFIHVTGMNAAIINQIFLNINDLDILDVFISLKTTFETNRYLPVKQLIN